MFSVGYNRIVVCCKYSWDMRAEVMKTQKINTSKKGAVKGLGEFQEKNCGKASPEPLDILKVPKGEASQEKRLRRNPSGQARRTSPQDKLSTKTSN